MKALAFSLFWYFFFLPIPVIASLMLCCCFIGIARRNKPLSAQSFCKYDNEIITVSDLTKTRDLKERTGCIYDRCLIFCCGDSDVFLTCLVLLRLITCILFESSVYGPLPTDCRINRYVLKVRTLPFYYTWHNLW